MKTPWSRLTDLAGRRGAAKEPAAPRGRTPAAPEAPSALMDRIQVMLRSCETASPLFPRSVLYNESWLLRLVLDWFSRNSVSGHPLSFPENGRWFSDGLLPTPFVGPGRRPKVADPPCHVSGVIGHFDVPDLDRPEVSVSPQAQHLMVVEATISGELPPGVPGARYLDQAARTVAGIAEALRRANRRPAELARVGFYLLAPHSLIASGLFEKDVNRDVIGRKVKRRAKSFGPTKEKWCSDWLGPTIEQVEVGTASWEHVIERLGQQDAAAAASIEEFYHGCLAGR